MRIPAIPAALIAAVLVLSSAPRPASADWPQFGRAIVTASENQVHSAIASDGAGGAIVTWQDSRDPRVNIFAQHVLDSGELDAAWPFDGQALLGDSLALATAAGGQNSPAIVPDGAGGAIVAWQDLRTAANDIDIFAQHILASGVTDPAWPVNGTPVVAAPGVQNTFAMVPDGAGGTIVTWMDTRAGGAEVDVFAQHLLATGAVDPRWPANGLAVVTAPGKQQFPVLVEDGTGGAIVAWDDLRSSITGDDVYAQHVLGSGVVDPAWPVNGLVVSAASGDQGRATIAADGAHGAIVAWSDSRVVGTSHIFAQHVRGAGTVDPAWPANGRAISNAGVTESRPLAISDGAGGAIVNWQAFTVQLNMYAQHVLASGVVDPAWPPAGQALSLSPRPQDDAAIVPDGLGGAVVAWDEGFDVIAQHVFGSGILDPAYPADGRILVGLASQQGGTAMVPTGRGGAIVSWTDLRNGKDADIYALQVLAVSDVGVPDPAAGPAMALRSSPNPARGALTLRFALPREANVRLAVYDMSGRQVRELAAGMRPAGESAIGWDLRDEGGRAVGAGMYFARLEVDGRALTSKLATLK